MRLIKSSVLLLLSLFVVSVPAFKINKLPPKAKSSPSSKANCGDTVTGTQGSLTSPNYPGDYNSDDDCEWRITAENGGRILVVVHDLITENNIDTLTIRDGFGILAPTLIELSGQANNIAILSTESNMRILFVSDFSIEYRGFNASWSEVLVESSTGADAQLPLVL